MLNSFPRLPHQYKKSRLLLIPLAILLLAAAPLAINQVGLLAPEPMAPFLNGNLPPNTPGAGSGAWILEDAWPNVTFKDPINLEEEPGTGKIMVASKGGVIYSVDKDPSATTKTVYLDIQNQVAHTVEGGLLGFTFHPEYADSTSPNFGHVYVFYRWRPSGTGSNAYHRISRFTRPMGQQTADPGSELVLIQQFDENPTHDGGSLFFGNDGFLYIVIGDEGGANDNFDNGQKINEELFAGLLRIDVDMDPAKSHPIRRQPTQSGNIPAGWPNSYTANYYIPNTNPFLAADSSLLEEFYTIGLRSPYRVTYDAIDDRIWCGDVGQGSREEVNILVNGGNYQWPFKEGTLNGPKGQPATVWGTQTPPLYEYQTGSTDGRCVIGGAVYRGTEHALDLYGKYIFGDNNSKRIWALTYNPLATPQVQVQQLLTAPFGGQQNSISAINTDADGEVYILKLNGFENDGGQVFKLARQNPGAPQPPALLSQTGAFSDLTNLTTTPGVIPYDLNVPFWSDGAEKARWIAIPNDGTHNTAAEQIEYYAENDWDFPNGTVLIKQFDVLLDESNPASNRRLETRFLIKGNDGKFFGFSYRWRANQTEADLLPDSWIDTLTVQTTSGPKEISWLYPGRGTCLTCHNEASKGSLGPIARQLNGDMLYPSTGITANQLKTWNHLGIFSPAVDTANLNALLTSEPKDELAASLELRARSYLDANCASCHLPANAIAADFDARLNTPLTKQNLIYGPVQNDLGVPGMRVVVPGDLEHSALYLRMKSVHESIAMPPLAKNEVDDGGVQLIADWIMSLDPKGPVDTIPQDYQLYFDFENGAGTIATDQSPNGNDGQLINGTNWGAGRASSGLAFDGINDRVEINNNASLNISNAITLAAWIRPNSFGEWEGIITKGVNNTSYSMTLTATGKLRIIFNDAIYIWDSNTSLQIGTWNHVAVTFDGNTVNFWINGIKDGNQPNATFNIAVNNQDLVVGAELPGGDEYFDGNLDEVYVYDRALADFEIAALANYPVSTTVFQRIDFPAIPDQGVTALPLTLNATSTSGLPVTYSVVSGPATVSGNTLTLNGSPGEVVIQASQTGDATYVAAPVVEQSFYVFAAGTGVGTGLLANYHNNTSLTSPVLTRVDPQIDFNWVSGSPAPVVDNDAFSVVWEGELEPPFSGTYNFTTSTDDGVRLWINNQLIIDQWQDQEVQSHSGTATLVAWQRVPIRMEYYEQGVYASARLSWAHGNITPEIIPTQFLYPVSNNTLPLELLAFEATDFEGRVQLHWITTNERNTHFFEVERSSDKVAFEAIASVPAQGNTNDETEYGAVDRQPLVGKNYYRLRMIDLDGSYSYSPIVEVNFLEPGITLFPNPVSAEGNIFANMTLASEEEVIISIFDRSWRLVQQNHYTVAGGASQISHPVNGISPGVYFIRVETEDQQVTQKLLVH